MDKFPELSSSIDNTLEKIISTELPIDGVKQVIEKINSHKITFINAIDKVLTEYKESLDKKYEYPSDEEANDLIDKIENLLKSYSLANINTIEDIIKNSSFPVAIYNKDNFIYKNCFSNGMEALLGYSLTFLKEEENKGVTPGKIMYSYNDRAFAYAGSFGDTLTDGHRYKIRFDPQKGNGKILRALFYSASLPRELNIRIVLDSKEMEKIPYTG